MAQATSQVYRRISNNDDDDTVCDGREVKGNLDDEDGERETEKVECKLEYKERAQIRKTSGVVGGGVLSRFFDEPHVRSLTLLGYRLRALPLAPTFARNREEKITSLSCVLYAYVVVLDYVLVILLRVVDAVWALLFGE